VAGVPGGLLDHVQRDPPQVGDVVLELEAVLPERRG